MKTAAVVNPKSASGKTGKLWSSLASHLPIETARFTEAPEHATALARELLLAGFERIIAVGGDGTVNEVVNGFIENGAAINPQASLAVLPLGTGSDFQRSLRIRNIADAIALICSGGRISPIDLAQISYHAHDGATRVRYFANLASFGMGGEVAAGAKNAFKVLGGKAAFLYSTLKVVFSYHPKTATLMLDGVDAGPFTITNIAFGNGQFHGGGMRPCPQALLDDGLLEVTVIEALTKFELARDLPVLYSENIYKHPKVRHFRASRIVAQSAETVSIEVDGEALGTLPLQVQVLPRILRVARNGPVTNP